LRIGISQHLRIGKSVVQPISRAIHYRNQICGVFGDELEEFVTIGELSTHALQLHVLVDRINIEDEDERSQPAHPILEISPILDADSGSVIEECKEDNADGEGESNDYSKAPQPPFAALNLADFERGYSG